MSSSEIYIAECSSCGAKLNQTGKPVGGTSSCQHKYGPIGGFVIPTSPKQKEKIVYPTDAERKWLRIMDRNKEENENHYKKFKEDLAELSQLRDRAKQDIARFMEQLRGKIGEREDQLHEQLKRAFEERSQRILSSMNELQDHKKTNEETKESAEDLLRGDEPEAQREKKIVESCEGVINETPNLKYVETELRFTFDTLPMVEQYIGELGTLHSKRVDGGKQCVFESHVEANKAPLFGPKDIAVPLVQLKNSTYEEREQRVKLAFKLREDRVKGADELDIKKHLSIRIVCAEEQDDEKIDDDFENHPIYEQTVPFSEWLAGNKKYEIYLTKKFNPGSTVAVKMRPEFTSPDQEKYKNAVGQWSRVQTWEIPDDEGLAFNLELDGQKKTLSLEEDDDALTNFTEFKKKFLQQFKRKSKMNGSLKLMVGDQEFGPDNFFNVIKYAKPQYIIKGTIEQIPPAFAEQPAPSPHPSTSVMSPKPMPHKIQQQQQQEEGPGDDEVAAAAVMSPKVSNVANEPGPDDGGVPGGKLPKQIGNIMVFKDVKKRCVLKQHKKGGQSEYNMKELTDRLLKKFQPLGLKQGFKIQTQSGKIIQTDQDIIEHLANNNAPVTIIQ